MEEESIDKTETNEEEAIPDEPSDDILPVANVTDMTQEGEKGIWAKVVILKRIMNAYGETRPDTRQSSRVRLGRSSNAKTAHNSKM